MLNFLDHCKIPVGIEKYYEKIVLSLYNRMRILAGWSVIKSFLSKLSLRGGTLFLVGYSIMQSQLSDQRRIGCVARCLWEFHNKAVVRDLFIYNFFVPLQIHSITLCWGIFWAYFCAWGLLPICATSCLRMLSLCFASVIDRVYVNS